MEPIILVLVCREQPHQLSFKMSTMSVERVRRRTAGGYADCLFSNSAGCVMQTRAEREFHGVYFKAQEAALSVFLGYMGEALYPASRHTLCAYVLDVGYKSGGKRNPRRFIHLQND